MENQLDLELGEDAVEQTAIEDRTGDLAVHPRSDGWIETRKIERHDSAVRIDQTLDETMPDLAASAGDEHDRFTHGDELYLTP